MTQLIPFNSKSAEEILRVAAAIDAHSQHPLAQAVVAYAQELKISCPRAENYQARSGRGAEGELDGHHYFVGNHRFAHDLPFVPRRWNRNLRRSKPRLSRWS